MKRLTACAALALLLASCAGNQNAAGGAAVPLVIARVKDAVILDPAQATDGMSLNLTQEMMKGLVEFKLGTFDVTPSIAQSWKMTAGGLNWTFALKKGLKFSDGTPIDAAAVKFNFDRWRLTKNPYHQNYPYGYYADMFGGFPGLITSVDTPNPQTVVFRLSRPLGPFLRDIAMPSFAIASPAAIRKDLGGFGNQPVGYGPYMLKEWVKDDHITLVANPTWQGAKPAYATVIVRDIPDQATSVLEMQRGGIDFLTDPRPDDAAQLAKQSGVTVYEQPSNNNSYLAFNVQKTPFGNPAVRQAIAYAIDVRAIVKAFYAAGAVVATNWTPPGMLGEDKSLQPYPYDPAKAKQLLAQAGLSNGFSTDLYYPTTPRPYMPEPERIAEAIQADLQKVGIKVTLESFEFGVFLEKVRNGEHQMCLIGWSGDNGDPDNFFYPLLDKDSALAKPNGQNYSFWEDEAFHRLIIKGQTTLDDAGRAVVYRQANDMVHALVPALPIVHTTVPVIVKSSIAGFVPSPDTHIAFEYLHPK
jgi:peptide/nickel transport system substrate-binding protein